MTLSFYIIRRFFSNIFKVQAGILVLITLIAATEELQFLAGKDAGFSTTLSLVAARLPEQMELTFPLVILLGSLFTFLGLSRSSELVIVRASGISALKLLIAPVITAVIIGIFVVGIFNPIVAATKRKHDEVRSSFANGGRNILSLSKDGIWLRQANENSYFVIQARSLSNEGMILFNTRFHEFATDGKLIRRINAQRAQLQPGEWQLSQATQWRFLDKNLTESSDTRPFDTMTIPTDLTKDEILENFSSPDKISIWNIPAFILQLEASGFSPIRHKLFLQSKLSGPLLLAAMVLIGAVFAFRPSRFGNTGLMALSAVLSGFLLYALKSIAESLGETEQVPIALAAWAPATAALLLALALLLHLEDG